MVRIFSTFFLLFLSLFSLNTNRLHSLVVNVISRDIFNNSGKQHDALIIKKGLEKLGHHVNLCDYRKNLPVSADINIFLAQFKQKWFFKAKLNWFIPNAEFCRLNLEELRKFDLILCKTKESLRIFKAISKNVYYLGFRSDDHYQSSTIKNFNVCLHLAGKSRMKGTIDLLSVWKHDSNLPPLIVVSRRYREGRLPHLSIINKRLPHSSLIDLQNRCGIHICPSKTEGFGHYIMEAMSAGAVVITIDAPPMNEFIKDKRCLIKYKEIQKWRYANAYILDEQDLARAVKALSKLSKEELENIGQKNRKEYLKRAADFEKKFEQLMKKQEYLENGNSRII